MREYRLENKDTDEAVQQTAGLAVYYDGKLIDAMYMSTCGRKDGRFLKWRSDTPPIPYLKSVFAQLKALPAREERVLEGRHTIEQVIVADDGTVANRNIELARVIGIILQDPGLAQNLSPARLNAVKRKNGSREQ